MVSSAIKVDFSEVTAGLDKLGAATKEHLPRSMAVAAGKVFRDEAKARAPVFDGSTALKGGSTVTNPRQPGQLQEAIYLAFSDNRSTPTNGRYVYSVSWNATKAPHGHLLEFGHWRTNVIAGGYPKKQKLDKPKWVPASPFLRPAYDSVGRIAIEHALARGRVRLSELLANPEVDGLPSKKEVIDD